MICIHPTAAHNQLLLAQLQARTGLRAVPGHRYARLVPAQAIPRPSAPVPHSRPTLCQCSFCHTLKNTQPLGAVCTRCNQGRMQLPTPPTGGSAA